MYQHQDAVGPVAKREAVPKRGELRHGLFEVVEDEELETADGRRLCEHDEALEQGTRHCVSFVWGLFAQSGSNDYHDSRIQQELVARRQIVRCLIVLSRRAFTTRRTVFVFVFVRAATEGTGAATDASWIFVAVWTFADNNTII